MPIKASEFYSSPSLKFLEEKFEVNDVKKEAHKSHVRNIIREIYIYKTIKFPEKLPDRLNNKGIHVVLRKSKGQLYGITYVDHVNLSVFNGSSLGKQYSAKGISERCEQRIAYNQKQYQRSISPYSENTQNLEYNEYLKNSPIDILVRVENTNDYVPKQIKRKKKE